MKPTRNQVIAVIKEFKKSGSKNFLTLYGYRESTKYDLLHEGHSYPPKAIYNVALKRASGEDDKSGIAVGLGGGNAVNEPLTLLRFKIVPKNKQEIDLDVPDAAVDDYAERRIEIRRGQAQFRSILFEEYERSCAITSCSVPALLDACHIKPYSDFANYHPSNGILLRTDIHTLFDLNLIKIHPKHRRIQVDKSIKDDTYQELSGSIVRKPKSKDAELNSKYLEERWKRNA